MNLLVLFGRRGGFQLPPGAFVGFEQVHEHFALGNGSAGSFFLDLVVQINAEKERRSIDLATEMSGRFQSMISLMSP